MSSTPHRDLAREEAAKQRVRSAFEAWAAGAASGSPFDLLAEDATWTITGRSPLARTYHSRQEFLDTVNGSLGARLAEPIVPTEVRGIFADGDWVIVLFDARATARDGRPYRNTYSWYLRFAPGPDPRSVVEVVVFFDSIEVAELFSRVEPA